MENKYLGSFSKTENESEDLSLRYGLVYARVSSRKQKNEGHGLESQEERCIRWIESEGVTYLKSFYDSYTGGGDFMKRPAMKELLQYIDDNPHRKFLVIFDDLKRFARDREFHFSLKAAFKTRDTALKCLNYTFDDSPEGQFVEAVLASSNELERKQNQRQVIQKQQARLRKGYWPFCAPLGYKKISHALHGTIDIPKRSSKFVKEAIEGFASNRFHDKTEVARFLQDHKIISNKQDASKAIGTVSYMLTNVFYAGYIEKLDWDVKRIKGHHEAIVDLETIEKNKKIIEKKPTTFVRLDIREGFELRGLVNCAGCGKKLTGAPSRSKTGALHPYYKCPNKMCIYYGKSIKASDIHEKFEELVKQVKATNQLIDLSAEVLMDVWKEELQNIKQANESRKEEKEDLEKQLEDLALLASRATNDIVLRQYEKQITKLGHKLEELEAITAPNFNYQIPYRTSVEEVFNALQNPYSVWTNYDVYQKQRFFNFIFSDNLIYDKNEGYRTPNYTLPITIFKLVATSKSDDLETTGIEPMSKSFV